MYNGSINLGDTQDLNVLKQEVELVAILNGQLKEFSSLKSNVSAVFEIFKAGASSASDAAKAIRESAHAGSEVMQAVQAGTAVVSGLSESAERCTDAVTATAGANQIWNNVMNISAIQITALIVAITAVVAAITTLVKILKKTNEAGEAAKASAEGLVSAQESADAYDDAMARLNATASVTDGRISRMKKVGHLCCGSGEAGNLFVRGVFTLANG